MEAITDVKGLRNGLEQLEATLDARHLNQRQQRHRFFWQEFVKQANFMPFLYGSGDLAVRYRSRSGELQLFDQGKMKVHSTSAFDFDQEVRAYLEQKLQDFQTLSAKEKCRRILKHSRIDIDFTKKQHSYMVAPSTWVLSESIDFDATLQLLQTQNRKALLHTCLINFFGFWATHEKRCLFRHFKWTTRNRCGKSTRHCLRHCDLHHRPFWWIDCCAAIHWGMSGSLLPAASTERCLK